MRGEGRRLRTHGALGVTNEPEILQPRARLNHKWEATEGEAPGEKEKFSVRHVACKYLWAMQVQAIIGHMY